MFVGSINEDLRGLLAEMAPKWKGRPVYVGCSGNLTVERILAKEGVTDLHGNDVSLYSCVLGSFAAGQPLDVKLKMGEGWDWMLAYMQPGPPLISHLLLCMEYVKYTGRSQPHYRRMREAYERNWPTLHAKTVARVTAALEGVKLAEFFCGDVVDFIRNAPEEAVVISFPPTYTGGYEKLYEKFEEMFDWTPPDYQEFDPTRFAELMALMREKRTWVTLRDEEIEELMPHCIGSFKTSVSAKTVYVYAADGPVRTSLYQRKMEPVPFERCEDAIVPPIKLVRLTGGMINTLKSEYLAAGLTPSDGQLNLGVLDSRNKLLGALSFESDFRLSGAHDAYMVCDFSIRPTIYRKLSKLIVAAALTEEVQALIQMVLNKRVRVIGTNAFTKKPVSMKYRGVFDLHSRRKEGQHKGRDQALYYVGAAGKWTMQQAYDWWAKTHAQTERGSSSVVERGVSSPEAGDSNSPSRSTSVH